MFTTPGITTLVEPPIGAVPAVEPPAVLPFSVPVAASAEFPSPALPIFASPCAVSSSSIFKSDLA